uniref:Helicase C-terminal domain-containing protein n=2 Tax=Entomoneis paludosa TaxID=265537 RepID=A0A7S2YCX9_9STRA
MLLKESLSSIRYLRLDGRVPPAERVAIAEQFNSDPAARILLLTTRVGSLGLNLTGADTVIFLEHDWNPFVDLQAMDRAHRIGQAKTVNVYKLVMQDTVEERIIDLQRKKTAMNEAVVNSENSSLYSLGTDRLLDIFTVDKDTAKDQGAGYDFDLDGLLESYGQDYASSLSVNDFVQKSNDQQLSNGGELP